MHQASLEGVWHEETGGTITLSFSGGKLIGKTTGGRSHESLRGTFTGHPCDGGFEGEYVNEEGPVRGKGRSKLEVLGPDKIRFSGYGEWSGGGASGSATGSIIFRRKKY
jgi:hypothetical protein